MPAVPFYDQYGASGVVPGGFGDAWSDLVHCGVYNGTFAGVNAVAPTINGWTITNGDFPITVVTGVGSASGNAVRYAPTAASVASSKYP